MTENYALERLFSDTALTTKLHMKGSVPMSLDDRFVPVQLANGAVVRVQVIALGGEEDIAHTLPSFAGVGAVIEGIAQEISETIDHLKPQKASLEFGLTVGLEAGQLTAVLVKGSGTASLKVTLEWSNSSPVA